MLRDKDRMPAPRRLLAVITGLTGSQPLLDELGCVHEDRVQSPSREIASVLVGERLPGTKRALPKARKQLVYIPHTGILRYRCLGREGARQGAELVVPFSLERVGDEPVVRIDSHEAALREIGIDLRPFNAATAQLLGLLVPRLEFVADVEGQCDRRRRHLRGHECADGGINGRSGDRLAAGLTPCAPCARSQTYQASCRPRRVA